SGDIDSAISVQPPSTTQYSVMVTDACGHFGLSDTVTVEIQCPIIIPNVITANGDGKNDFFIIQNIDQYPGNQVYIYNRWGTLVFSKENYANDWDGEGMSEGTYFYIVDDKINPPQNGFLTILR